MVFNLRRRNKQISKEPARGWETGLSREEVAQGYERAAEAQRLAGMNATSPWMFQAYFGGAVRDSQHAQEIRRTAERS